MTLDQLAKPVTQLEMAELVMGTQDSKLENVARRMAFQIDNLRKDVDNRELTILLLQGKIEDLCFNAGPLGQKLGM